MSFAVSGDLQIALRAWSGPGPGVLAVHATGFCKEMWEPVVADLRRLGGGHHVVAMDQRGHGDSGAPALPCDWWDLGRDALAAAATVPVAPLIGVGHSSGAAALIMAELLQPETFRALLLIEPIVFPPPYGRIESHQMTETALRRRSSFASPEEARENFAGKQAFAAWDRRVLDAYVAHGLRPEDGRWVLKCRPEVEGEFYRGAAAHGAWDRLGELECPVHLVAGASSDTHAEPFLGALASRFRDPLVTVVEGTTHFVPMEQPEFVAEALIGMAAR